MRVADQRVDQRLPGSPIIPVARRFADRGVVVVTSQYRPHRRRQPAIGWSATIKRLRIAARSWVTVSWVATASNSGVESSTRRRPVNNPAARAVAFTSSNNRRGRSTARSRFRTPTSTVG